MKWISVVAGFVVVSTANSATLFYAGDFLGGTEHHSGPGSINSVYYENFQLSSDSRVHTLYGNHVIIPQGQTFVEWELRVGMSEGNGGTIIASDSNALATVMPTGRFLPQFPQFLEYSLRVEVLDILLSAGSYWMAVRPLVDAGLSITSGINGFGPTAGDQRSIGHGQFLMQNYKVLTEDWSYGVEGEPVPEPITIAGLGVGMALLRFRRRSA